MIGDVGVEPVEPVLGRPAPQPAHQIIQGTLTQLLDLDMTQLVP